MPSFFSCMRPDTQPADDNQSNNSQASGRVVPSQVPTEGSSSPDGRRNFGNGLPTQPSTVGATTTSCGKNNRLSYYSEQLKIADSEDPEVHTHSKDILHKFFGTSPDWKADQGSTADGSKTSKKLESTEESTQDIPDESDLDDDDDYDENGKKVVSASRKEEMSDRKSRQLLGF